MGGAWIFDLDGTLTVPAHDFSALKRALGLPLHRDVLGGIRTRPASEHADLHAAVVAWELEHVDAAQAAPGAASLLSRLDAPKGILTRNTRAVALATLDRIGLLHHFEPSYVWGRDEAAPKPSPEGVRLLLRAWGVDAAQSWMVGDHVDDLRAGRGAGARAMWVDHAGDGRFASEADRVVCSLEELNPLVG